MIELRGYQNDMRVKLRVALRSSSSVLCVLPPRAGKTVLAAALIQSLLRAGKRVIFAVHRVDLITQTAKTFKKFNIPFSYVASGLHYNPLHRCYIASIDTLKNRMTRIKADYIFVDEAHLSASAGWSKVVNHYLDHGAKLIGLTGSPERLDGKPLGDLWQDMVEGPTPAWMIENGHLSRYRAFAPKGIDYSGVKVRKGEMVAAEVEELEQGKAVIRDAAKHWKARADGLRTIAFCRSVKRCEEYADEFNRLGIPSVALDGSTPRDVRRKAFLDFADGSLKVIFSCQLFSEGFDLSAQVDRDVTVECVLLLAPTASLARHIQQTMRALTKKPFPAIILDLVGNLARLGFPDDERVWSLDGKEKRDVATIECPGCGATIPPMPKCRHCGEKLSEDRDAPAGPGPQMAEVDVELEEVDVEALRRQRKAEQGQAETLEALIALATARGYKSPDKWAAHVWTARQQKERQRA